MSAVPSQSWVEGAERPGGDFPLENLPLGVVAAEGRGRRICAAIGDSVVDLRTAGECGLLARLDRRVVDALAGESLNAYMALGRTAWRAARAELSRLLGASCAELRDHARRGSIVLPQWGLSLQVPCEIGDYTDFYASLQHATNIGTMFRPTQPPLLPNWKHLPVGYHGRSSSIVPSGTPVVRPCGQTVTADAGPPAFGPSRLMDYEVEVGALVGTGNALGTPIPVASALDHVFGLVLLNDWSARDIQKWEYQPLGPFLGKNFASTLSGWVVSLEALEPFRLPMPARPDGDPQPLPYLQHPQDSLFDIHLELLIASAAMRERKQPPTRISLGNFRDMYWSIAQMVAHHTCGGCNLRTGDLLGSGTVSGADPTARGSMLERAWRGTEPVALGDGSERTFLRDGDEVILRGWCERPGAVRIGFGECRGILMPARG